MLYYGLIFIFGIIIGSFLNVVIYRLKSGEPIINSRSHCLKCKHVLSWYELIPVFSFLTQKGRCRACGGRISWQYPLVELGTGVLFSTIAILNFKFLIFKQFLIFEFLNLGYLLIIASLLVVIFVYDLKHYIIPDKILYPTISLVLVYRFSEVLNFGNWNLFGIWDFGFGIWKVFLYSLLAAILSALFFLAIFLVTRGRGLGFGDVKFAFFMGLFLGWPNILAGLFLSWILGGIIGIALLLTNKKGLKSQIPFGPFLASGTLIAMLWGERLIHWYLNTLGAY